MNKIKIAKIINTHALKGELKLELYTDFAEQRFQPEQVLWIGNTKVVVESFRLYKQHGYVKFKSYNNINLVEQFKNQMIEIEKEYIHQLEDGEYYFFELKGLKVFHQNELIGKVLDVIEGVAQNLLLIGDENNSFYIPYVDAFVKNIDLEQDMIEVNLIEGIR